jgi:cell division protease FtsH
MSSPPPESPRSPSPPDKPTGSPKGSSGGADKPRSPLAGPWLIVILILGILLIWMWQSSPSNTGSTVGYSFFRTQLVAGNVKEVRIYGDILTGEWKSIPDNPNLKAGKLKARFNTVLLPRYIEDDGIGKLLFRWTDAEGKVHDPGIVVNVEKTSIGAGTQMLFWLGIPLVMFVVFWFLIRRASDPMGGGMMGSFTRSSAKRFEPNDERTTFDDVAAMEQAKRELMEIVEFLKNPTRFQRLGAQIPKGVLLMGPPGTGKTLLARATAGEAGVPFFSINGSEFIQMFVGVGASRVRDLFQTAKQASPCIVFIDEIDAVGRVRGAGLGGGHDEREQTLNQILSEMDGFQQNEAVIVLAATNRPDVLDPALLRPGRFDRHITIDPPAAAGRVGVLKVHCRKVPLADDIDLKEIGAGTIGFSGADLRNLVNEAALNATREGKSAVDMEDFESARDRVLMGTTREEILNEHEREMTAYHESGHALLAWLLPEVDSVHKVTIIPRGRALGVTQLIPDEERFHIGEKQLHSQIVMMLGGRAAEKLVFDEFSAGAENDLKRATDIARRMVAHWGMSEVIGPVAFRQSEEHPFLGKEIHEQRQFSEETARIIDQEVQRFLTAGADRATELLIKHREELNCIANALLEHESLGKPELIELLGERVKVGADGNGQKCVD